MKTIILRLQNLRIHKLRLADVLLGLLSLAFAAVALAGYGLIGDGALRVLMWPHAAIAGAYFHITLPYHNGIGYVALEKDFIIGPACMGIRFIVMLFCMTVCFFVHRFHGARKIAFFALSLVGSAVIGVIASCVRIIGSVPLLSSGMFTAIHAGSGTVIYLLTIIGVFFLVNRISGGRKTQRQAPSSALGGSDI